MTLTSPDVLTSLVYVSSAVELFSHAELRALLDTSRRNNTRSGITGMLLYKDGNFMQVLEGPATCVRDVHERIGRDPRHTGLITLMNRPIAQRQFVDWSMGFRNLADSELHATPGYSEFLNVLPEGRGVCLRTVACGEAAAVFPGKTLSLLGWRRAGEVSRRSHRFLRAGQ